MKLKPFLQGFGLLAIILTLVPFIAADYWWIRIFDFPHTQLTILTMVALCTYFYRFDIKHIQDYIFVLVLTGCFIYQLSKIAPFLPHGQYEMGDATTGEPDIKFYLANVYQKNEEYQKLRDQIYKKDADVLLFMETDTRWMNEIRPAVTNYPYRMEVPLDNTYGMLLYSKFSFKNEQVQYLVDDSIPSMNAILQLPGGKEILLYCIHPSPPMPQHNPKSTDRDAEMMLVAKATKQSNLPVIVAGDFNDVAWSQSTFLFKDISGLLDPRIGRGFYNTFNAKSILLRWPLDHFFASEEFRLNTIRLGEDINSDHFPAYFEVSLEPQKAEEQKPEEPTQDQIEQAREQIQDAREDQAKKKEEESH